jgi:hypothetical protein
MDRTTVSSERSIHGQVSSSAVTFGTETRSPSVSQLGSELNGDIPDARRIALQILSLFPPDQSERHNQ